MLLEPFPVDAPSRRPSARGETLGDAVNRSAATTDARPRYMLDANAFDYLLDRAIDPEAVRRLGDVYITTVQHGELLDVPDRRRRERLLAVLAAVDPTVRPGFAESSPHDKDAVIGDVAALEGCTLVTDDKGFRRRAAESGLPAVSCAEAFAGLDRAPADRRRGPR